METLIAGAERRDERPDRRTYSIRTLWTSVRSPRRMSGRRGADRRFAVLDHVEPGVGWLAILLVSFSILDAMFTLTLLGRGGSELNPVMDVLLQHSVVLFSTTKMALTAIPALLLVATANLLLFGRLRARSLLGALTGLYAGLIVYELLLLSAG